MLEFLAELAAWLETLPPSGILLVVGLVAYLENVVPPIPGDMVVVFGGYLAGMGLVSLTGVILLSSVGGLLGFMTMFLIGRWLGDVAIDSDRHPWLPRGPVNRVRAWLRVYGFRVVLANRFLSGARSVIALMVGASRMDATLAAICSGISATIWTVLIVMSGYVVGDNWERVADYLSLYGRSVTAVLILVGLFLGLRFLLSKRRAGQENAKTSN